MVTGAKFLELNGVACDDFHVTIHALEQFGRRFGTRSPDFEEARAEFLKAKQVSENELLRKGYRLHKRAHRACFLMSVLGREVVAVVDAISCTWVLAPDAMTECYREVVDE